MSLAQVLEGSLCLVNAALVTHEAALEATLQCYLAEIARDAHASTNSNHPAEPQQPPKMASHEDKANDLPKTVTTSAEEGGATESVTAEAAARAASLFGGYATSYGGYADGGYGEALASGGVMVGVTTTAGGEGQLGGLPNAAGGGYGSFGAQLASYGGYAPAVAGDSISRGSEEAGSVDEHGMESSLQALVEMPEGAVAALASA